MADADPNPDPRSARLARWTRLPDAKLGECYVTVWHPGPADEWQVIVATHGNAIGLELCRQADRGGFLEPFARAIANWEKLAGRPDADILELLDNVIGYGVMQGMTNQQKGFMNSEILLPLLQARDACAIVLQRGPVRTQLGTGFLVGPDLVLTAAHVVMDVSGEPGAPPSWAPRLKSTLAFEFKARPNQPPAQRVEVLASPDKALVSFALPYGEPPDRLDTLLDPPHAAAAQLDFALIRLAQRVDHVVPVDIVEAADVEAGKPCWLFGFPGGNALMMDVDLVDVVKDSAGRWLHRTNAAAGMSGGCCVNHVGQVAGIHEGTQQVGQDRANVVRNRGVCLGAIRQMQRRQGKDPLTVAVTAPGLEFHDKRLVEELYRAGLRLGGEAIAAAWRDQVNAALGCGNIEASTFTNTFHPWFARDDVERWIASTDPDERLCLIYGDAGVGKSFCARILRESRAPDGTDLLWLTPTHLNAMGWADAISQLLVPENSQYRTAAAAVRYRDVEDVVEEMRRRSNGGARPYHVAMDFGPGGSEGRFIGAQWIELAAALAAQPWIRIMLIDLNPFERAAVLDRLSASTQTQDVIVTERELRPIGRDDFLTFAQKLAKARGSARRGSELRDAIAAYVPPTLDFAGDRQPLQTVSLALAAIAFEATLS